MAEAWGLIVAASILLLTFTVALARRRDRRNGPAVGIVIGAVCGLVAAFVIIQPRLDVIPDEYEPVGVAVLIVIVSLGLIMLIWRGGMRE